MAINNILEEIKKQAEQSIAELDAERDKMIEKITQDYAQKRTTTKEEMNAKVKDNSAKVKSRAETFAKMETRNNMLRAKREILMQVFEKTVTALLTSDKYVNILVSLLKKAATEFSEGTIIPAQGKEAETKSALEKSGTPFKLATHSVAIKGGFLLESEKVEVNFAFDSILAKELWDQLELELNKLLFF